MLNKLFGKLSGDSRKKGFTMTELIVVVGIIAIVCAIAIPAIISMNKSLKFKQANEYAESIFMAAQANLTEMRSDGQLIDLFVEGNGAKEITGDAAGFPTDQIHRNQYMYATSADGVYDVLVPKTSVDSDARDGNVLIEYNPYTGNVYAVFYKDGGDTLSYDNVSRDEDARRELLLGYYCGSALSTEPLTPEDTEAKIDFKNDQEFMVEISIPIPQSYKSNPTVFESGLEIYLRVDGDDKMFDASDRNGKDGWFSVLMKAAKDNSNCRYSEDGKSIIVSYSLDSLRENESFARYAQLSGEIEPASDSGFAQVKSRAVEKASDTAEKNLTKVSSETAFNIYPGENISISAEINFKPSASKASVNIHADTLANVNPMFDVLMKSSSDSSKYVLGVSNGRNLQNLNAIAPKIAEKVKTVSFTDDIDWNDTVTYYKDVTSSTAEAPARALPYFVPIHNENLFGTAQFVYPAKGSSLWDKIKDAIENIFNINLNTDDDVPTLTDELDRQISNGKYTSAANTHATVSGAGHKVLNIKIDASKYALVGDFYALDTTGLTGTTSKDTFTGLFGYVNTTIDGLSVVNPIIKGGSFNGTNNPATGALVGAAGFNTLITNCSTYIDTSAAAGFNRSLLPTGVAKQPAYDASGDSYGVKGSGAVGGLVGYAKSHRTVTEELGSDKSTLAFSNCFASVPVSGHMRGNSEKHYGYTNGVGGLVGNAEISNFYNCYASGDVLADGVYVQNLQDITGAVSKIKDTFAKWLGEESAIDLLYNGRTSMGAGGFVGTSHGVRYTNCFASGDVLGSSKSSSELKSKGTAGFVGIMSYEETHAYGNDVNSIKDKEHTDVAQMTVFQNCYAVGLAKSQLSDGAKNSENFSGANCRIKFDGFGGTATKYWSGSYYQVYAPWWFGTKVTPDKNGIERLPYESFVFKDSYYISQYTSENSDQTNACASPVTYTSLTDLTAMQNNSSWIDDQLARVKSRSISNIVNSIKSAFGSDDDARDESNWDNFGGVYFGDWVNAHVVQDKQSWFGWTCKKYDGLRYAAPLNAWRGGTLARALIDDSVRLDRVGDKDDYATYYKNSLGTLEDIYRALYKEGFPASEWDKGGTGSATHGYDTVVTGAYPFSKLKKTNDASMEYYGRWPAKKLAAGLAYYELYDDGSYGYYFDRDQTSTLNDSKTVVSDGYAILSSDSNDKIKVTVGDSSYTLTNDDKYTATYTTENSVYYVHRLPWEALQKASTTEFYTQLKVVINDKTSETYTFYFNPNLALTQVNPVDDGKEGSTTKYNAVKPTKTPTQVYIRTARQLAAMGNGSMAQVVKNKDISFVQELDVNASLYTAGSYTNADTHANAIRSNASVGEFDASYTGKGVKEQATVSGFNNPIFGILGETAKVSDLAISCSGSHNTGADAAGLLAGINKGTVTNVDVTVEKDSSVTAKQSAGLLIGVNSGTVSDCEATVSATVTVKADEYAGGVIGMNAGTGSVKDCKVSVNAAVTVNATNAGGFVGAAKDGSIFNNVEVSGSSIKGTTSVGAFAGLLENTTASNITVSVGGTVSASTTAAGFAANVTSGKLSGITVTVADNAAVSAQNAAGLIGTTDSTNLLDTKVNIAGSITGTDSAVGAVTDFVGGNTTTVKVLLTGGKISAPNNAAGFTLDVDSSIQDSIVCGSGEITATAANGNAAGFAINVAAAKSGSTDALFNCFVSPADHTKNDLSAAYLASSLDALKISAASGNAAGFAVNVLGTVTNSTAVGTVTGANAAGFAVNVANSGSISGCMANTDTNGSAFAKTNTGLVSNCYAWYTENGTADDITKDADGNAEHYYASYFAPITPKEGETSAVTVVKGTKVVKMTYDQLSTLMPEELSPVTDRQIWKLGGKDSAYPFTRMWPANYPYPMLREHYGNWVNPTQYAYGFAYYEKDSEGNVRMNLVDASFIGETDLRGRFSMNNLDKTNSTTIAETGYALFYHTSSQIILKDTKDDVSMYEKFGENDKLDFTGLTQTFNSNGTKTETKITGEALTEFLSTYEFRIMPGTKNAGETVGILHEGLDGGVHMIVPAYANAIYPNWTDDSANEAKTYEIRTAPQFGNMNSELGAASAAKGFEQTHNFTMNDELNITEFKSLSYDGGNNEIMVSTPITHGIFGDLVGEPNAKSSVTNLTLTGAKLNATGTAGIVANTVDKESSISNVTIVDPLITINATGYTKDSEVAVGAAAGVNSGKITDVKVETTAQVDILSGEPVKNEAGKAENYPFVIDASATKLNANALNLTVGGLVGHNTSDTAKGATVSGSVTANIEFTPVSLELDENNKTKVLDTTNSKTEVTETVKLGGVVGHNQNGKVDGSVTGDISYKTFTMPADDVTTKLTSTVKLGGLVGHSVSSATNGASVSGTVTGNVGYTRPAVTSDDADATADGKTITDAVMLGGIVGQNQSGTVGGTFAGKATNDNEVDKSVSIVKAADDKNASVIGATYIGGIVGSSSGGSFDGTVTASGAVKLDSATSGYSYVGGVAGYIYNANLNGASAASAISSTATSGASYVGGIVGSMSTATLTGANADSAINAAATTGARYVGGIAGSVTNVTLNGSNTDSAITTDAASGNLYVGGLVGRVTGSKSMNGDIANGSITVNGAPTAGKTFVGGAIGEESVSANTAFTGLKTSVAIKSAWTNDGVTVDCPSGYKNVGKFVGKVSNGTYTNCTADGTSDLALQFLGTINKTKKTISGSNYYSYKLAADEALRNLTGKVEQWPNQTYIGKDAANKDIAFAKVNNGAVYYIFAAKLNNCVYTDKAGSEFYQTFKQIDSFYTLSNEQSLKKYEVGKLTTDLEENGEYIVTDFNSKWALKTNGGSIETMEYKKTVYSDEDNFATIWRYEGTKKLKNEMSGKYLFVDYDLSNNSVEAKNSGQFLYEQYPNGGYVRFYDTMTIISTSYHYLNFSDLSNGTVNSKTVKNDSNNNTKLRLYTVNSTPFTRATMTYSNMCDWTCTSTPKT